MIFSVIVAIKLSLLLSLQHTNQSVQLNTSSHGNLYVRYVLLSYSFIFNCFLVLFQGNHYYQYMYTYAKQYCLYSGCRQLLHKYKGVYNSHYIKQKELRMCYRVHSCNILNMVSLKLTKTDQTYDEQIDYCFCKSIFGSIVCRICVPMILIYETQQAPVTQNPTYSTCTYISR